MGLDLRPRRLREAAELWEMIGREKGTEYRDAVWSDPGRQPTAEDLDDPSGYFTRREEQEKVSEGLDEELRRLLDGGYDDGPSTGEAPRG